MIDLEINDGLTLSYDEKKDKVLVNGKPDKNWTPVFARSGDDEPDFYGFHDNKNKKVYNLNGVVTDIVNEKDIKIK